MKFVKKYSPQFYIRFFDKSKQIQTYPHLSRFICAIMKIWVIFCKIYFNRGFALQYLEDCRYYLERWNLPTLNIRNWVSDVLLKYSFTQLRSRDSNLVFLYKRTGIKIYFFGMNEVVVDKFNLFNCYWIYRLLYESSVY